VVDVIFDKREQLDAALDRPVPRFVPLPLLSGDRRMCPSHSTTTSRLTAHMPTIAMHSVDRRSARATGSVEIPVALAAGVPTR